jgi:hypothetical protein
MLPLELNDPRLDLEGQPIRLPIRPTRSIREPFQVTVLETIEDL